MSMLSARLGTWTVQRFSRHRSGSGWEVEWDEDAEERDEVAQLSKIVETNFETETRGQVATGAALGSVMRLF